MEVVYATLGTLSGVSILLLALGLSLGLRPWPPVPWLRPWLASYWVTAFSLLGLSLPLVVPSVPIAPLKLQTFAFLNSCFFLATGFQAVGWARLRWGSGPLLGAFLPMAVYLGLFLGTGVQHNPTARMILFSSFQAALQGILALWAHQGLRRQAPHLMIPCSGVLALHGLYHLGRVASSLLGPGEMDYILSVAVTVVEGLLYTLPAVAGPVRARPRGSLTPPCSPAELGPPTHFPPHGRLPLHFMRRPAEQGDMGGIREF